jgi:MFS family permease
MLFVLIGGAVADRLPRLAIMLSSDLIRGVLVIGVALLTFSGSVSLWLIIGMSFCFGLVDAFFLPAYRAVIPQVIPQALLPGANALMVLSGRSMAIAGPSLGAILIVIGGIPIAFALDGLSFFLSAICLVKAIALLPELARKKTPASTSWCCESLC